MHTLFLVILLAAEASAEPSHPAAGEIELVIARDPYTSGEHSTLCRVRAINHGARSWSGRDIRFEARAVDGGVVARQRGRFGLTLPPYGSLETLVGFTGRRERFEVKLLPPPSAADDDPERRGRSKRKRRARGPRAQ